MAHILIVDDSLLDRTRAVEAVRLLGHSPLVATDGNSAFDLCRSAPPDLVLMDLVLAGGEDGYAVTRRLRNDPELCDIPVVMVTSRDQRSDAFWGYRQGAAGYVTKPYRAEELASVIARLLVEVSARRRLPGRPSPGTAASRSRRTR
ncbi:response regulator [Lysobacter sp. KIS68-7]|uniref:response regulator n=1 Tax=Lysobacter sp. KIS68-7 TaxID=2904252 RepID=UPI001E492D6E|nr:response regulator [Lysobacter sp. KIS68-7]UHQ18595.1 response regulator [Lysobacter sp. KIS68-7]